VVLTGLEAAATSSKDELGYGGPANNDYGSDSTDRLQLELRPPPAKVTLVAQTETPEETNMDVQEMREVGEQKQEPPAAPKANRKRKRKAKDRGRAFSDKAQKQYEERQRHKAGEGGSMS
jgi:hypothetical protein